MFEWNNCDGEARRVYDEARDIEKADFCHSSELP